MKEEKTRLMILIAMALLIVLILPLVDSSKSPVTYTETTTGGEGVDEADKENEEDKKYVKWVDFNVSYQALCDAYDYDVKSYAQDPHLNWIELLAYIGAKNGGNFKSYRSSQMAELVQKVKDCKGSMKALTKDMKYYDYYYEIYEAVLGGFVGEYDIQAMKDDANPQIIWEKTYGLKAFLPLAKNFPYSDFDDFGVSRSYGYRRRHLGHDMMGQVGTPVIAVESGYVEAIGWNQYGGWRIGIRSFDKKRYYYYAHLRKNYPYYADLKEGSIVTAGDVIGYMGRTGYSAKENTNNIDSSHLHFGIQLIFDESQKEGNGEIWIDCYNIVRFLYKNRSETVKVTDSKEWKRIYDMKDPVEEEYRSCHKSMKNQ